MIADNINGIYEMLGGIFVFMNVIRIRKDKTCKGVSPLAVLFFLTWGYWNLYYYPSLNQWWSAAGALSIALVNTVWFVHIIYYRIVNRG